MHAPLRQPRHGKLLCGLALTRIIGWGSTFYSVSVLAPPIERELGLTPELTFGGITILLITGALLGPGVGRHLDLHGTRRAMCVGAVICALGLASIALAQGPVSYLASWFVLGIGHAMTLANVGNITVAQLMGERARRTIGIMMLATGLSSSVFWPLAAALTEALGWRGCWLVFAAMQLVVVLPIHACIPAWHHVAPQAVGDVAHDETPADTGRIAPSQRKAVFWLLALIFSASGLVSWGLPLHLIGLLQGSGLSQATAVGLATLSGPATLLARAVDALAGERFPVEKVALAGLALGPLACLVMALASGPLAVAAAFVICFSAAMGVISVARATLPLVLFGRRGFGAMLGRLAVPQNLAFAVAPLLFAVLMERLGPQALLLISAAVQGVGLAAMLMLIGRLAPARRHGDA